MKNAPGVCARVRVATVRSVRLIVFTLAVSPASGATIFVPANGSLQAALNAAEPGDLILLEAGALFRGKYTLPVKSNPLGLFITVRSAADDSLLPPAGTRLTPSAAGYLPKLKSTDTQQVLYVPPGASYWRLSLLEFQANVSGSSDIIRVGSNVETVPTNQPHHIVFDRVYVHGDPQIGQRNAIVAHASDFELRDSYISDIKLWGVETHGFLAYNGAGPYLIENNYIEASSINVLFGGADPRNASMIPSNVIFRRNHLTKNLAWMFPNQTGKYWNVKNLFEIKTARTVRVEGNVFEHNWTGAGDQPGAAILMRTENQSGSCAWCESADIVFEHNLVRRAPAGLSLFGIDYPSGTGTGGVRMHDVVIRNNLFADLDTSRWYVGSTRPTTKFAMVGGVERLTIDHNTIVMPSQSGVVYFTGSVRSTSFTYTNNMSEHKTYGFKGDATAVGSATLAAFTVNPQVAGNVLAGGAASVYPAGNFFPSVSAWQAEFVDYAGGDYRLRDTSVYVSVAGDGSSLGARIPTMIDAIAGRLEGLNNHPAADVTVDTVVEDEPRPMTLSAGDPDGDSLTFATVTGPAHGTASGDGAEITYTPAANYNGTDRFTFAVTDGRGGRSTAVVTLTVTPVNDAPIANPQTVSTRRNTVVRFTLDAADVDGDALAYSLPLVIDSGTLSQVSGATFEYRPNDGFSGADSAEYTASDGLVSASAVVTIQVADPLTILATTLPDARRRASYSQQLQASGGVVPYSWSLAGGTLPPGLTLGASDGMISGTPSTLGTYTFTVRVTDQPGTTADAALSITVRRR